MASANSIVITKESNGNVLVTPEGTPYTIDSSSKITEQESSVLVNEPLEDSAIIEFTAAAVEKVVRADGTETLISDASTLFSELNTHFFYSNESGYQTYQREFTQQEFRDMFTANGGFGYEVLPAPGVGKYNHIISPTSCIKFLSGSTTTGQTMIIYNTTGNTSYSVGIPATTWIGDTVEAALMRESQEYIGVLNEASWVWAGAAHPGFLGTVLLTFQYKVIDTII